MNFNISDDFSIFEPIFIKRPELDREDLKNDLKIYYLPYVDKLLDLKSKRNSPDGIIIGVSAIQGAGKSTQGEILETLLDHEGYYSVHLSIDDHYITHQQLEELRRHDPRYIRRGVTHDIDLAMSDLNNLKSMKENETVFITSYDKGAFEGDGDRTTPRKIDQKPDFIFYDGWMLGARRVLDEEIFESGLPALDSAEHIAFAKEINRKLDDYERLWKMIDFMNVLYVSDYQVSIQWRDEAEEALRNKNEGMTHEQIVEFVHYFWRSVHPAIQIKNLANDRENCQQVVVIGDHHEIIKITEPGGQ